MEDSKVLADQEHYMMGLELLAAAGRSVKDAPLQTEELTGLRDEISLHSDEADRLPSMSTTKTTPSLPTDQRLDFLEHSVTLLATSLGLLQSDPVSTSIPSNPPHSPPSLQPPNPPNQPQEPEIDTPFPSTSPTQFFTVHSPSGKPLLQCCASTRSGTRCQHREPHLTFGFCQQHAQQMSLHNSPPPNPSMSESPSKPTSPTSAVCPHSKRNPFPPFGDGTPSQLTQHFPTWLRELRIQQQIHQADASFHPLWLRATLTGLPRTHLRCLESQILTFPQRDGGMDFVNQVMLPMLEALFTTDLIQRGLALRTAMLDCRPRPQESLASFHYRLTQLQFQAQELNVPLDTSMLAAIFWRGTTHLGSEGALLRQTTQDHTSWPAITKAVLQSQAGLGPMATRLTSPSTTTSTTAFTNNPTPTSDGLPRNTQREVCRNHLRRVPCFRTPCPFAHPPLTPPMASLSTAQASSTPPPSSTPRPCFQWLNQGWCRKGTTCPFFHDRSSNPLIPSGGRGLPSTIPMGIALGGRAQPSTAPTPNLTKPPP
jgi:hypothetical protein